MVNVSVLMFTILHNAYFTLSKTLQFGLISIKQAFLNSFVSTKMHTLKAPFTLAFSGANFHEEAVKGPL